MIPIKRKTAIILLTLFLLTFTGCPIMMPFMMGFMMKKDAAKDMDAGIDSTMGELMHESVAGLANNKGPYEQILVRKIEISEDFMSLDKFQQTLLDVMHSENGWRVLDHGKVATIPSDDRVASVGEVYRSLAMLDTQLYRDDEKIWLEMQLVDARLNHIFWSGIYSRPFPTPG
jgi:hypothetical protein